MARARRRPSWARGGLVLSLAAALVAGWVTVSRHERTPVTNQDRRDSTPASSLASPGPSRAEVTAKPRGVPYVDVTLTPTYPLQDLLFSPAPRLALAFVVASPAQACRASWGAAYSLQRAGQRLDLDRRISQLRVAGGDVTISFGGQQYSELAVACTDLHQLTAAYREVVQRYAATDIDIDIEGTAVADRASVERRARALAALQRERTAAGKPLDIWLTLPVSRHGLDAHAVALIAATLRAGVQLRGVNVMTMDFGTRPASMLAGTEEALTEAAGQLGTIYAGLGVTLDEAQRWAHLGATPMIGQNDVDGEVFTLDDARGLAQLARQKGLGRVSLWSINRDTPCPASPDKVAVHSPTCSGVAEEALAFTGMLADLPSGSNGRRSDDLSSPRGTTPVP